MLIILMYSNVRRVFFSFVFFEAKRVIWNHSDIAIPIKFSVKNPYPESISIDVVIFVEEKYADCFGRYFFPYQMNES
jgi:hypothetical protein